MFASISLKAAPKGFVPACYTQHGYSKEGNKVMRQWFKGEHVHFDYDMTTGEGIARVDNREIGRWKDITVGMWGNILYTLQTEFSHRIDS